MQVKVVVCIPCEGGKVCQVVSQGSEERGCGRQFGIMSRGSGIYLFYRDISGMEGQHSVWHYRTEEDITSACPHFLKIGTHVNRWCL